MSPENKADPTRTSLEGKPRLDHWSKSRWEEIATRAYARWVQKGRPQGTEWEDWFQAEAELEHLEEILRDRETRLQLVLDQVPAILWTTDGELRITSSTGTGLKELNFKPNQAVGLSLFEYFQTNNPELPPLASHLQALEGKASSFEYTWMGQTFQVHVEPLRNCQGRVTGCIGLALNITLRKQAEEALKEAHIADRKKAEHRLAAEHAVAKALAEAADLSEAGPRVIQAVCQILDWNSGATWSLDPQLQVLHCQGFWHRPENPVPEFEAVSRALALPPGVGLIGQVWKTGKPVWLGDLAQEGLYLRGPEAVRGGLRGALAFPIKFRDTVLAVLEFYTTEIRKPDYQLLETLSLIGNQLAQFLIHRQTQALNNERESELRVARRIQQSLLPRTAPLVAGFDIAGSSRPAQETGGDYFDFLTLPDGTLAVAIGDASGHGVAAALLMTQTRAYLRTFAIGKNSFEEILPQTNRCLAEGTTGDWFVTLLLARLDPSTRCLTYSNAGHPNGIVLDAGNRIKARLTSTAPPLGIFLDNDFPLGQPTYLEPGDLIVLVTDGILESQMEEGPYLGQDRFLQMLIALRTRPAAEIVPILLDNIQRYASPGPPSDDMTVVVIKVE